MIIISNNICQYIFYKQYYLLFKIFNSHRFKTKHCFLLLIFKLFPNCVLLLVKNSLYFDNSLVHLKIAVFLVHFISSQQFFFAIFLFLSFFKMFNDAIFCFAIFIFVCSSKLTKLYYH